MFLLKAGRSLFFFLFVLDVIFLGAGVDIPGVEISSRKLFFGVFFILSFFAYFGDYDSREGNDISVVLMSFLFLFVWVFLIPFIKDGNIFYAISDAMPLVALGVFLLTVDFPRWKNTWIIIRRLMLCFLYVFSLIHIVLYIVFIVYPQYLFLIQEVFASTFDVGTGDDARFVFFTPLEGDGTRVYFGSSFFLLIGVYFFFSDERELFGRGVRSRYLFAFLMAGALWATNTRSFMMGAVSMVFAFMVFSWLLVYLRQSWTTIFVLIALPLFLVFFLIPTVDVQLLESLGLGRVGSDDIRSVQLYPLFNAFFDNFIFGAGFGASATFVRSETTPYAYELSILALFMKIGILGVLVACGIFASTLRKMVSMGRGGSIKKVSAVYALYFSFVVSCFYNPYAFGLFGTLFLLFVMYEFSFLIKASK